MSPALFESLWQSIETASQLTFSLNSVPSMEKIESDLSLDLIYSMASGVQDGVTKFFFFAQHRVRLPFSPLVCCFLFSF